MVTFTEVMKSKHDNLTVHRLVEVQFHEFLVSAVCYGEWTADVPSHGKVNVKVKFTRIQALRLCTSRTAHRGSRGIALLFHDQRH